MPKIARTSDLNERISFYEVVVTKTSAGVAVKKPAADVFYSCWAAVRTQMLSEVEKNLGTDLANNLRVIIRHQSEYEIQEEMFFSWNGKLYRVIAFNLDTYDKEWDTILAKEVIT
ncbi:head-tail adaptor protein [Sporolactobacillus shoreae]|uniref:Head-tail adaptor protein n=1 Tax=Sporolactobacillus shoreae TaxID=1465501 RepID=A0A4Z0GJX3_9BACL|nr:phage head closure protein [Sporolactobacillus shoreae]TGA95711.1 head-tail adaptor protein [Sporolactobacillus shoreae]